MPSSKIAILGAPLDLGAGRRGVDMGASAVRLAGLNPRIATLGYEVEDLGNIPVPQPEAEPIGHPRARYLPQIAAACQTLAARVEQVMREGRFPLVLGGDHSVAVGAVSGVSSYLRGRDKRMGLLWIDAHTDMNTPETSPSGNVHGMPLACCVGLGPAELTSIGGFSPKVDPANVVLVGIRSVDSTERANVQAAQVHVATMRDIDERGLRSVMDEAILRACEGTEGFHVSLDMDAVDPQDAPGVGTPVRGGLTYREAHLIMEMICDSGKLLSFEAVEVNPVIDEANRTASLAVELIMSALGKRIL
jgi:arginase